MKSLLFLFLKDTFQHPFALISYNKIMKMYLIIVKITTQTYSNTFTHFYDITHLFRLAMFFFNYTNIF